MPVECLCDENGSHCSQNHHADASDGQNALMSDLPRPIDLLPHRPPFLLVDELIAVDPGVSATGIWRLTGDEYFFPGHFPGRPTLPGVMMCESIAQVGACAVLSHPDYSTKPAFAARLSPATSCSSRSNSGACQPELAKEQGKSPSTANLPPAAI
jgi:hypothetical protein